MKYQILTVVAVGFLIGCGGESAPFGGESPADTGAVGGTASIGGKGGSTATGGSTGTGGAMSGTGGASSGGASAGGSSGTGGSGGAVYYPACSSPPVVGTAGCSMFVSATKTLSAFKDGKICNQCAPFLSGDAECTLDSGKYLCVHSCGECEFKCVAPGCLQ